MLPLLRDGCRLTRLERFVPLQYAEAVDATREAAKDFMPGVFHRNGQPI
jgi:hypothetical protein